MCTRTKATYGCGCEYKTDSHCHNSQCNGQLDRHHLNYEGDCKGCRRMAKHGGYAETIILDRAKKGFGRYGKLSRSPLDGVDEEDLRPGRGRSTISKTATGASESKDRREVLGTLRQTTADHQGHSGSKSYKVIPSQPLKTMFPSAPPAGENFRHSEDEHENDHAIHITTVRPVKQIHTNAMPQPSRRTTYPPNSTPPSSYNFSSPLVTPGSSSTIYRAIPVRRRSSSSRTNSFDTGFSSSSSRSPPTSFITPPPSMPQAATFSHVRPQQQYHVHRRSPSESSTPHLFGAIKPRIIEASHPSPRLRTHYHRSSSVSSSDDDITIGPSPAVMAASSASFSYHDDDEYFNVEERRPSSRSYGSSHHRIGMRGDMWS